MNYAAALVALLVMAIVIGYPIETGPYLGTFVTQKTLIDYTMLAQISEAAVNRLLLPLPHWQNCGMGLGMELEIGLVTFGHLRGLGSVLGLM